MPETPADLAALLGLDEEPEPRLLCGRPLPPWKQILRESGIPDAPGHYEAAAAPVRNPRHHKQ